ncbi:hypothetical protein D3C78_1364620 [compost metagenome]
MKSFKLQGNFDGCGNVLIEFDLQNNQVAIDSSYRLKALVKNIDSVEAGSQLLVEGNADVAILIYIWLAHVIDYDLRSEQVALHFFMDFT